MTAGTGQSEIDQVREATDLVRLVSEHVAMQPRGREYVGLCPFHDDHKPSFAVVTHKGSAFFHCFACGASGDCFRFVMRFHNMEFGEALRYLAERAGITLQPRGVGRETSGDGPRRTDLIAMLERASAFFQRVLTDPTAGTAARNAIEQRGIDATQVERFHIGAAPDSFDGLLRRLEASDLATARAAGLLKTRQDGSGEYDAFRNRLIFPICDEVGRPVAFGGRILDPEDQPKYLNSAESRVFQKSRTLYGLHLARRAIMDASLAIVTEGYTDVIACHQAGFENVVGTLGTALTADHARILARICDTVVLLFDGDEAGQKAADRGVEVFFTAPVDVRICVLPDGVDPDDLLRLPDGAERFRAAVETATDALAFKLDRFRHRLDGSTGLSGRQRHLEAFLRELGELGFGHLSGVRKRLVLTHISDLFRVPVADIERALPRRAPAAPSRPHPSNPSAAGLAPGPEAAGAMLIEPDAGPPVSRARGLAERELLSILLFDPGCGERAREEPEAAMPALSTTDFRDPPARRLAEIVLPLVQAGGELGMDRILGRLPEDETAALAARLFREGRRRCGTDETDPATHFATATATLRRLIEREAFEAEAPTGGGTSAGVAESVAEQIRRRSQLGHIPAAIAQDLRSGEADPVAGRRLR